jgi:hypothetical protein
MKPVTIRLLVGLEVKSCRGKTGVFAFFSTIIKSRIEAIRDIPKVITIG